VFCKGSTRLVYTGFLAYFWMSVRWKTGFVLIWIKKARVKDKTCTWGSVWWKTQKLNLRNLHVSHTLGCVIPAVIHTFLDIGFCCLLLIDKARAKDKTFICSGIKRLGLRGFCCFYLQQNKKEWRSKAGVSFHWGSLFCPLKSNEISWKRCIFMNFISHALVKNDKHFISFHFIWTDGAVYY
jgi:hypothetical protein